MYSIFVSEEMKGHTAMQFNEVKFNAVVEAAKIKAAGCPRWLQAIERAAEGLRGGWIVTEHIDHILITTSEEHTYKVNGRCNCQAAQNGDAICKHRAAKRLITLYNEMTETAVEVTTTAAITRADLEREIEQRWAVRFPTFRIDHSLRKFYGVNF